jgi:hypothetical protein
LKLVFIVNMTMKFRLAYYLPSILLAACVCTKVKGQGNPEEVAKKLANPIANMISMPLQNNTEYGIGKYNGTRNTMNFQPVIPFALSQKMTLITRYILPITTQINTTGPDTKQNGLSDALISAFFSPTGGKLIWGVGPAFLVPTATNEMLGTQKFGIGPTVVALKQMGPWTVGALANQIWSVAGDKTRADVNQLYLQPFVNHNWKSGAGIGLSGEITKYWQTSATVVYIVPTVSGVTKLGKQIISLAVGPRVPVAAPSESKGDWGWRGVLTFVFPK